MSVLFALAVLASMFVGPSEVGMAMPVPHFITSEISHTVGTAMLIKMLASPRISATVAIMTIVVVVYMSPEALATAIPRAGSDEDAVREPLGPVVAIRSAVIGRIVEVAVGADWRRSDLHCDLSPSSLRRYSKEQRSEYKWK